MQRKSKTFKNREVCEIGAIRMQRKGKTRRNRVVHEIGGRQKREQCGSYMYNAHNVS